MKKTVVGLVLACVGLSAPASASVIYTYTGNNFTFSSFDPSASPTLTTNDHMTLTFTVANVLPANITFFQPTSWSVTAGPFTVTSATPGASLTLSIYGTTAGDIPVVSCFQGSGGGMGFGATIAPSNGALLTATTCQSQVSVQEGFGFLNSSSAGNSNLPGTWTVQTVTTPPPPPPTGGVPEPASLGLLGLGAVALVRRHNRSRTR